MITRENTNVGVDVSAIKSEERQFKTEATYNMNEKLYESV